MGGKRERSPYNPPPGFELGQQWLRTSLPDRRLAFINPDAVWMIRWAEKQATYFLDDGSTVFGNRPMKDVLLAFPGRWERVHRQVAVRPSAVLRIEHGEVHLRNGDRVRISRRQWSAIWHFSVPIYRVRESGPFPQVDGVADAYWDRS